MRGPGLVRVLHNLDSLLPPAHKLTPVGSMTLTGACGPHFIFQVDNANGTALTSAQASLMSNTLCFYGQNTAGTSCGDNPIKNGLRAPDTNLLLVCETHTSACALARIRLPRHGLAKENAQLGGGLRNWFCTTRASRGVRSRGLTDTQVVGETQNASKCHRSESLSLGGSCPAFAARLVHYILNEGLKGVLSR